MSNPNYKQLEADGQMRRMIEGYAEKGWTSDEIIRKGYTGMPYEIIDRVRHDYLKAKGRLPRSEEPETKGGKNRIEIIDK